MDKDVAALKRFLERTPFFGGIEDGALGRITGWLVERTFAAGAEVFRGGDTGRSMFVVASGELVARGGEPGSTVKLMRFRPGDFFGETTLIEMQPRPFTVVAESDARLYELGAADLYQLYREDVKAYVMVLQNINRELCRRLRKAQTRIADLAEQGDEVTQIRLDKALLP